MLLGSAKSWLITLTRQRENWGEEESINIQTLQLFILFYKDEAKLKWKHFLKFIGFKKLGHNNYKKIQKTVWKREKILFMENQSDNLTVHMNLS